MQNKITATKMLIFLPDNNDQHTVIYLFVCPFIIYFPRLTQIPPQNCTTVRPLLAIGQLGGCCENICHSSFNEAPCWPSCAKWRGVFLCVISTWTRCNTDISLERGEVQFPRICVWMRLSVMSQTQPHWLLETPCCTTLSASWMQDIVKMQFEVTCEAEWYTKPRHCELAPRRPPGWSEHLVTELIIYSFINDKVITVLRSCTLCKVALYGASEVFVVLKLRLFQTGPWSCHGIAPFLTVFVFQIYFNEAYYSSWSLHKVSKKSTTTPSSRRSHSFPPSYSACLQVKYIYKLLQCLLP